jgi:hypothetical protein
MKRRGKITKIKKLKVKSPLNFTVGLKSPISQ